MALNWSANQYESSFIPKRLQNHEVPLQHRKMPNTLNGFTTIIGNDRGHLLPGVNRSNGNPWGDFVGTWDLPHKISGNCNTVPTARNQYSQEKMKNETHESNLVLSGQMKNRKRITSKEGKSASDMCQTKVESRSGAKPPTPQHAMEHDKLNADFTSPRKSPASPPLKLPSPPKSATPPKPATPEKPLSPACSAKGQTSPNPPTSRPNSNANGVW